MVFEIEIRLCSSIVSSVLHLTCGDGRCDEKKRGKEDDDDIDEKGKK